MWLLRILRVCYTFWAGATVCNRNPNGLRETHSKCDFQRVKPLSVDEHYLGFDEVAHTLPCLPQASLEAGLKDLDPKTQEAEYPTKSSESGRRSCRSDGDSLG